MYKKILFLSLFIVLMVPYANAVEPGIIDVNINVDDRNNPVIYRQEIDLEGNTAFVKNSYLLRYGGYNFSCLQTFVMPRPVNVWDYEVSVNSSVSIQKPYIESKLNDTTGKFYSIFPCGIYDAPSTIVQKYSTVGLVKEDTSPVLYPFDKYYVNYSSYVYDIPVLFFLKITLPENTIFIDYPESYIYGPFVDPKVLVWENTKTGERRVITSVDIAGYLIRFPNASLSENRYTIIYPQYAMAPKYLVSKYLNSTQFNVKITWERPIIIKLIWIFSIFGVLLLIFYLFNNKIKLKDFITGSAAVWGLQEGINQLIPSTRPLEFTIFEIPLLLSILAMLIYSVPRIKKLFNLNKLK